MPDPGLLLGPHWLPRVVEYALASLTYLLLARLILVPVLGTEHAAMRLVARITDPVWRVARASAPRIVPVPIVTIFAMLWLLVARMVVAVLAPAG